MKFSGKVLLRKTSLIDYPGLVAAVIFFPGCNLRCPWCHNRELVMDGDGIPPEKNGCIGLEDALAHIKKRGRVLGGVVLSGGEPSLFNGLPGLISEIKSYNLKVKLDTNGVRPDVLENLFERGETRPDFIAMDLKLAPGRYAELTPGKAYNPGEAVKTSAALIRASGLPHEFRSLALPEPYFGESDIEQIKALAGDSPWNIRPFVPGNCLDPAWNTMSGTRNLKGKAWLKPLSIL